MKEPSYNNSFPITISAFVGVRRSNVISIPVFWGFYRSFAIIGVDPRFKLAKRVLLSRSSSKSWREYGFLFTVK